MFGTFNQHRTSSSPLFMYGREGDLGAPYYINERGHCLSWPYVYDGDTYLGPPMSRSYADEARDYYYMRQQQAAHELSSKQHIPLYPSQLMIDSKWFPHHAYLEQTPLKTRGLHPRLGPGGHYYALTSQTTTRHNVSAYNYSIQHNTLLQQPPWGLNLTPPWEAQRSHPYRRDSSLDISYENWRATNLSQASLNLLK